MPNTNSPRRPNPANQLITDLPLIRRYARANEPEDNQFRAYLKHQLPISNSELDAMVVGTTRDVWSKIDCLACGNCCRTLQVIVDDSDIARLSARLTSSAREFHSRFVATAPDGVKFFSRSPCPFLGDDNACSVYEDRPQSCRDFPYLLDPGFRRRSIATLENVSTCPIVFNVWQSLKRRFSPTIPATPPPKEA